MKYISGILRSHINKTKSTYEFFGGGFLGLIGTFGLQFVIIFRVYLFLLMAWLLFYGFKEMAGENFWTAFGGFATLATGVMALFAAGLTVSTMRRQINSQEDNEAAIRKRNLRAELTVLPVVLANISEFSEQYGKTLASIINMFPASAPAPSTYYLRLATTYKLPKIGDNDFESLKNIVRFLDVSSSNDSIMIKNMEKIIRLYQILKSREGDNYYYAGNDVEIEVLYSNIHYTAEIFAAVSSMFTYARREASSLEEPSVASTKSALRFFGLEETEHPTPYRYAGIGRT